MGHLDSRLSNPTEHPPRNLTSSPPPLDRPEPEHVAAFTCTADHAPMASDHVLHAGKPSMTDEELVAYIKNEFQEDAARAQLQANDAGVLTSESAPGMTLDLSHKFIRALPVEVIGLIKDKVER